jgi:hypothetical protein
VEISFAEIQLAIALTHSCIHPSSLVSRPHLRCGEYAVIH